MSLRELLGLKAGGGHPSHTAAPSAAHQRESPVMASSTPHHQHQQMAVAAGQKRPRPCTPPTSDSVLNTTVNPWREQQERLHNTHIKQMDSGGRIGAIDVPREAASVPKFAQQQPTGGGSAAHGGADAVWRGGSSRGRGGWGGGGLQDQLNRDFLFQQQQQQQQQQQGEQQQEQEQQQQQEEREARHHWEQRHYRELEMKQEKQRQQLLNEAARQTKVRQKQQQQRQKQIRQQQHQQHQQQQQQQQQRFESAARDASGGGRFLHNPSPSPPPPQQQQPEKKSSKKKEQSQGQKEAGDTKRDGEGGGKQELVALKSGHGVAVDHLNMLIGLVEEMTCKWERQLEDSGEGKWTDDMLAKEGTDAMKAVRSAALAGPALPVGVIDWPGVASSLWRRHSVAWSPQLCQGLWKFVAYGDVAAAMNALPRPGETLNGAWTRQDLLYESDTEALSINPLAISKKDTTAKNPRWGRSRSSPSKKHERIQAEKARSKEPLRRAPMLMSGSVDLRHSPERPKKAGTQQTKGRASHKNDEDQLIPLCTLAALATSARKRKRLANGGARSRDPLSPRSAKAAAEVVEAEARVYEERQAMQLLLEQSAADSSAANQQNPKGNQSSGKAQSPKASSSGQGVSSGGTEGSRLPEKKKRKKSSSVERVSPEAAKQAEIWAAAGDAAATAAAAAAAASAAAAAAGASTSPSAWPSHRPTASAPQAGWRNQAESYPASAGGPVTSASEDARRSPTSAVYSPPPRSAMNAASATLEQDALRERLKRGERQPVHPPGLGNQRALKKAEEQQQQQASRQQEFQGNHHLRLAVSEASSPPVPPTANIHGLRATASLASSQAGGDGTTGRPLSSPHPTVQQRHSPSGPSFSNQQQHQQQHQQHQQQRSYQQAATPTAPSHQNRQSKVTYIHMPSATHGSAAQSANAGDAVTTGSPSPRLHPATGVELARAGEVRSSRIGTGGSGGGAGLLATSRGQSSWNRAEGYSTTGGPVPGNPSPRAAGYGARSPVSSAGSIVPGFGAIGGGVGVHHSVSSEAKE